MNIPREDFDRILQDLVIEEASTLLSIDGIYEIIAEHFNNDIIDLWELES